MNKLFKIILVAGISLMIFGIGASLYFLDTGKFNYVIMAVVGTFAIGLTVSVISEMQRPGGTTNKKIRQECPDNGLEIHNQKSVQCPVNGEMPANKCRTKGEYHQGCPLYHGEKTITDLAGEDYDIVICDGVSAQRGKS